MRRNDKPFGGIQVSPRSLPSCYSSLTQFCSSSSQATSFSYHQFLISLMNGSNQLSSHLMLDHGKIAYQNRYSLLKSSDKKIQVSYILASRFRGCERIIPVFISILSEMRQGRLREDHMQLLKGLSRPLSYDDGIQPSELWVILFCQTFDSKLSYE